MPKFRVDMTVVAREYRRGTVVVEAANASEAMDKAYDLYDAGEVNTEFEDAGEEEIMYDYTEVIDVE